MLVGTDDSHFNSLLKCGWRSPEELIVLQTELKEYFSIGDQSELSIVLDYCVKNSCSYYIFTPQWSLLVAVTACRARILLFRNFF